MSKSKKKKNRDFQKVKLKVGKRLPKADNETRTNFKARTIQVPQQLKHEALTGEPTTHRKLGLSDLMSQLQHYNVSVRHSAVAGLKELILRDSALLDSSLSVIVVKTSELFTDKDPVVRQAVIRLLKSLLPKLSANQISPFFPVVSAHLCCAMTHIYEDIRLDSLSLLDEFLEHFPGLVTNSSSKILPNFVEQISTRKTWSSKAEKGKSLFVNPTSKLATLKWRVKVLERLQKFLSVLASTSSNYGNLSKCDANEKRHSCKSWKEIREEQGIQPFTPVCKLGWTSPSFVLGARSQQDFRITEDKIEREETGVMTSFAGSLLPLLLECWVEAMATEDKEKQSSSPDGLVTPDSMVVMTNVASVIQLLWRYVKRNSSEGTNSNWLPVEYCKDFTKHFMSCFPYSVHDAPHRKDKKGKNSASASSIKVSALSLNLAVCDIMSNFLCARPNQNEAYMAWFAPITDYLISVLQAERLSQDNLKCVIAVIREILKSNTSKDTELHCRVYKCCYDLYSDAHTLSYEKRILLDFLSDQILRPVHPEPSSRLGTVTDGFLQELPDLLKAVASSHQQMAAHVLKLMKEAMVQHKLSLSPEDLTNMLNPSDGILISLSEANQRTLVEILYYVDRLEKPQFRLITKLIKSSSITEELSCYLLQSFFHRYIGDQAKTSEKRLCTLDTLLSFFMTVALGVNEEDLAVTSSEGQKVYLGGYLLCLTEDEVQDWGRHRAITEVAVYLMSQLPQERTIWRAVSAFLDGILKLPRTWTCLTAWAMVAVVNKLYSSQYPITDHLKNCLIKLSLSLMHSLVYMATDKASSESNVDWSDYSETVRTALIGCLHSQDQGLLKFMEIFKQYIQSKNFTADMESAVTMLTHIVKSLDLLTYLEVDLAKLKEMVKFTQEVLTGEIDEQVLADLKYHTSLLKPGGDP